MQFFNFSPLLSAVTVLDYRSVGIESRNYRFLKDCKEFKPY